jgi:hypothetical protein
MFDAAYLLTTELGLPGNFLQGIYFYRILIDYGQFSHLSSPAATHQR